ncbi:hypothetical protein [Conexibacter woesei]|uniref:hypothetical protein n=1 Tax=Conexibacter woesei TaxID=191495 RepID=UPI00047CDEFB|nr:hypothetical protein [Conexibacter woesei]
MDRTPDVGRIKEHTRALSKSLLGTQFRAEVGAFIAVGRGPFWAREMAGQLDVPENKVSAELSRLATNNLLTAISIAAWDRRRLYERSPRSEPYWAAALDILRRAAETEALRAEVTEDEAVTAYLAAVHGDDPRIRQEG